MSDTIISPNYSIPEFKSTLCGMSKIVCKTATVFENTLKAASDFTGQAPEHPLFAYGSCAAKIGVSLASSGLLMPMGPVGVILVKPILQNVASRIVIIAGNTLYRAFFKGVDDSYEKQGTPFSVQVLGGVVKESFWYSIQAVILPFDLGVIGELTGYQKTAIKTALCAPVKQLGCLVWQTGYNQVASSDRSPLSHLSFKKVISDIAGDLMADLFRNFAAGELKLGAIGQGGLQITGALLGNAGMQKILEAITHIFQRISQSYSSGKFADSTDSAYMPKDNWTVRPSYNASMIPLPAKSSTNSLCPPSKT